MTTMRTTYSILAFHALLSIAFMANSAITSYDCPKEFAGCIDIKGEITKKDVRTMKLIADQVEK
jgi:hypothetical protein